MVARFTCLIVLTFLLNEALINKIIYVYFLFNLSINSVLTLFQLCLVYTAKANV